MVLHGDGFVNAEVGALAIDVMDFWAYAVLLEEALDSPMARLNVPVINHDTASGGHKICTHHIP